MDQRRTVFLRDPEVSRAGTDKSLGVEAIGIERQNFRCRVIVGVSSMPLRLGRPVTGLPDWPTMGIVSRIRLAFSSVLTLRIDGLNSGTQKVRRLDPSTLICPLGPRSVSIQNSSRASLGPCHKSLPTEPKRTLRSLVTLSGSVNVAMTLFCAKTGCAMNIDTDASHTAAAIGARPLILNSTVSID